MLQLLQPSERLERDRKGVNLNIRTICARAQPHHGQFAAKSQRPPPTTTLSSSTSTTTILSSQLILPTLPQDHVHALELERPPRRTSINNKRAGNVSASNVRSIRPPTIPPPISGIEASVCHGSGEDGYEGEDGGKAIAGAVTSG